VKWVIDASSLDCAFGTQSVLENPSDGREEKNRMEATKLSKDEPKPNPGISVNRPLLVAPCTPFKKTKQTKVKTFHQAGNPNRTKRLCSVSWKDREQVTERTFLSR